MELSKDKMPDDSYGRVYDDEHSKGHDMDVSIKSRVSAWWSSKVAAQQNRVATYGALDWVSVFLPCLFWLRRYKPKEYLLRDLAAGLSIGAMVIPQGMSYALLAGLAPEYGLYGAFVPVLIYAMFGSSPQLAVGPVAVTSLLLSTGLHDIVTEVDEAGVTDPRKLKGEAQIAAQRIYTETAIQVAFIVSIMYTAVGILQLGFLANFLSHSVISGFTSGAAVIIACSQLKYFFGVKTANTNTLQEAMEELHRSVQKYGTNWKEMAMGLSWVVLLLTIKQIAKRVKRLSFLRAFGPITVAVLSIIIVAAFNVDEKGIKIIQYIPPGLPPFSGDIWVKLFDGSVSSSRISKMMTLSLIVMLVDFTESISIAKTLARRGKYQIAVTQEIIGLGFANFMGAMFSAYTTTGSFSRSAVSADVGSKTGLFGVFTALLIMFTLLVLTSVFELVPYNVLGAVVVSACIGLFEGSEAIFLFKANFLDFLVWIAAFIGVCFGGIEIGLAIAIGLALLLVVYQSAFPHTAALGRLPGTTVYRSIAQYPNATMQKGIVIMRVDAPVYFANVQWIRSRLEKYLEDARADPMLCPIKFVIIDLSPVPFIDATGMHAFIDLCHNLRDDGIQLVLSNPCTNVKNHIARVHLLEDIGKEWIFIRTSDAVEVCSREIMDATSEGMKDDYKAGRGVNEGTEASSSAQDTTLPIHWPAAKH